MRQDFTHLVDPKNYGSFMDSLYGMVVNGDTTSQEKITKTIQAFLGFPEQKKKLEIEAFTTKGDMPELFTRLPYINIATKYFDFGYEAAYSPAVLDVINGQSKLTWELVTGSDTIVFSEMAEGEAPVVASATATKVLARCTRHSGALGWTDELIRDRSLNILIQRAELFRNKFYEHKANQHYAGMTAAATVNSPITWQTTTETVGVTLDRDRKTINAAAGYLANLLKDKGYGDTANANYLLFLNATAMKARAQVALATANTGVIIPTQVVWNVTPVYTLNTEMPATTTTGIMVLPGNKIQRADAMQPTSFMKVDVASMTYQEYVHAYYGYTLADTDQLVLVQFA
jgi:hypothetical protein